MRTVLVSTSYPGRPDDPAGHFVRTEALALVEQGHDVHVVTPVGPDGLLARDSGITTWPIAHGGAFGWPGAAARLRARPWRVAGAATFAALASSRIDRLRPDRTVAHWLIPCACPVASSCRHAGDVEAVAHGADVRLLMALPPVVRARLMARVLTTASRLRFAARASLDDLARELDAPLRDALMRRAQVQSPFLAVPDVSSPARRIRAQFGGQPLAVTVSRLVPSKRIELAIGATHRLHPKLALGIVGDGPDRRRLGRLPGAQSVRFEGNLPRESALAWIAAAHVLIHPSLAEAAPTAIREARMLGTPVVACDSGDVRAWSMTDDGITIVDPEPDAIAAAVGRVI